MEAEKGNFNRFRTLPDVALTTVDENGRPFQISDLFSLALFPFTNISNHRYFLMAR